VIWTVLPETVQLPELAWEAPVHLIVRLPGTVVAVGVSGLLVQVCVRLLTARRDKHPPRRTRSLVVVVGRGEQPLLLPICRFPPLVVLWPFA